MAIDYLANGLGGFKKDRYKRSHDDLTIYSDNDSLFQFERSANLGRPLMDLPLDLSPLIKDIGTPLQSTNRNTHGSLFRHKKDNHVNRSPLRHRLFEKENDQDEFLDSLNDASFDRELLKELELKINKPQPKGTNYLGLNISDDDDRTELIIKETHRLIKSVPLSILGSRESENYLRLLRSSTDKLIKTLEQYKRENRNVKLEIQTLETTLSSRNSLLEKENESLKIQLQSSKNNVTGDTKITEENELLREKLRKYKNLYDAMKKDSNSQSASSRDSTPQNLSFESKPLEGKATNSSSDNHEQEDLKRRLVDLYNGLSKLFKRREMSVPQEAISDKPLEPQGNANDVLFEDNLRLLKLFEALFENVKHEKSEMEEPPQRTDHEPTRRKDNAHTKLRNELTRKSVDIPKTPTKPMNDGKSNIEQSDRESSRVCTDQVEGLSHGLLERVLNTMDINNDLYTKILQLIEEGRSADVGFNDDRSAPSSQETCAKSSHEEIGQSYPATGGTENTPYHEKGRNIILKCFMCCRSIGQQDSFSEDHIKKKETENPRRKPLQSSTKQQKQACKRCESMCSSAGSAVDPVPESVSLSDSPNEKNNTINLMGEYKWTI